MDELLGLYIEKEMDKARNIWDMFGDKSLSIEKKYKAAEEFKRLVADHPGRVARIDHNIQLLMESDDKRLRDSFLETIELDTESDINYKAQRDALSELGILGSSQAQVRRKVKRLPEDKIAEFEKIRDRIAEKLHRDQKESYERANAVWESLAGVSLDEKEELAVDKYTELTKTKKSTFISKVPNDY
jgi:hypothetical protein